ncbi:MAG: DUF4230 domain-containing protein [Chloroflexi bacterium]|nr:DUF4230 domain-containing protein [Chloroflexota bacterium]
MVNQDTKPNIPISADQLKPPAPNDIAAEDDLSSGPSGCVWGMAGGCGCLLLSVVAIVGSVFLGITTVGNVIGSFGGLLGVPPAPVAQVVSTETIVTGLQPLAELTTVETQLAKALTVGVQQGALNACGVSATYSVEGIVAAGIDLSQITVEDVTYDAVRDTYVITLPAPQLTTCDISHIDQVDNTFTTCVVNWDEMRQLAEYNAQIEFRDDAVEGGLLDRAEIEARIALTAFFQAVTGSAVELNFRPTESGEPLFDSTCNPPEPGDWTRNANTGSWER